MIIKRVFDAFSILIGGRDLRNRSRKTTFSAKRRKQPMNDSNTSKEERIRHQAYRLWVAEGRPEGRDREHWEEAEQIINREDARAKEDERGASPAVGPVPGP
jgi:hypothetical protein